MKKNYIFISIENLTKRTCVVLLLLFTFYLSAQQAPSIQSGVSFQWSDEQSQNKNAATIESIIIDGEIYNTFVVPSSYELTHLGPDGHSDNRIIKNGNNTGGNSNSANWVTRATAAFQDKNLNHYFACGENGEDFCLDFEELEDIEEDWEDDEGPQKQTIFYNPSIPSNEGGVLAVTERGGNNCFYIEIWGTPFGGGPEQKLGHTFVRSRGDYRGCSYAPPISGSDYWQSGRCNENGQTIGIGLFYLSGIAPVGSKITKIEFVAATEDHGDGKFFLLQKYALDQQSNNCLNDEANGDVSLSNNAPQNSAYSLISPPTVTGQDFTFNSDGTYSYTPQPGFTGEVTFEYEVCLPAPNTDVCDRATVTLNYVDLPPNPEVEISCTSENNFSIFVVNPIGEEFEYSLNNGSYQSSVEFNNLSEGSYTLKVRNRYTLCERINPNPITISNLELSGTVTDVLCTSDVTGNIDLAISGGFPPYTFNWSNDTTNQNLTNVGAGTYSVTVTDSNGCSVSDNFTINQPDEELTSTITKVDVLCFGDETGSIDLSVNGGTAPYSYSWNSGQTTRNIENLGAGIYSVTITDANGCIERNQIEINQPNSQLRATLTSTTNVDCYGNSTGSITFSATGGTSPYQYSLDNGATYQTSGTFNNLAAGPYRVIVTDANGCQTNAQCGISEPSQLTTSLSVTDVQCFNDTTGAIDLTVSGGTQPYTYEWSNDSTTEDLNNLGAGAYSVTVTDANGCTISTNTSVSEPATPLSINISKEDATSAQNCSNGGATANVNGGTGPYTYLWSTSANNQTTATAINLTAGSHDVTVTDANGCQLTQSVVIRCVNTCDAEVTIEETDNVSCFGENTGSGTVSASSNSYPDATYTFSWSNGQIDSGVTTSTISNVGAGVYDVSVTIDGTSCQPVEESIAITQPNNALNIIAIASDLLGPLTNDGIILTTVTGGVPPYTYKWSPGGETTPGLVGLLVGNYSVTVTDANGCTAFASASVNGGSCNDLSVTGASTSVSCNGESNGSVTATVSNGTGPFTYSWDNLPDTTATVSNLPAGNYTVTVTDQTTECTQSTTINVSEPSALSSGIAVTNVMCKGDETGSVDLTVNGGTPPYQFLWNTNETTEDLNNVSAGTYSVTITDANGCTTTNQSTVLEPGEEVSGAIIEIVNVECSGENTGSINSEATGGVSPYSYSIDGGATNQTSGLFENLAAGNYTILITDANGCLFSLSATVATDDEEDPVISVPENLTIEGCSESDISASNAVFPYRNTQSGDVKDTFASNADYSATDDFNIQSITYIDVVTSSDNCPTTVIRTFTITDNCGNTASTSQTITVTDSTAPLLESVAFDFTVQCDGNSNIDDLNNWLASNANASASDACGPLTWTNDFSGLSDDCGGTGSANVTFTATDSCGNSVSTTATFTIEDTVGPTFDGFPSETNNEQPSCVNTPTLSFVNYTEESGDGDANTFLLNEVFRYTNVSPGVDVLLTIVANVNASVATLDVNSSSPNAFKPQTAFNIPNIGDRGYVEYRMDFVEAGTTNPITLPEFYANFNDIDGNSSYGEVNWSQFTNSYTVNNPTELTIGEEGSWIVATSGTNEFSGGTNANPEVNFSTRNLNASSYSFRIGAVARVANARSSARNHNIEFACISNYTNPTTVRDEITVECDDLEPAETLTATDNCSEATVTFEEIRTDGECAQTYTLNRTWTATDACGNETKRTLIINVIDTTSPTFTVPADITIECDDDANDLTITGDVTDEADNCSTDLEATFSDAVTAGSCANESTITRTWTLTDECDNTTTLVQTITVVDTTEPTFTVPADITIECDVDATDLTITGDVTDEADNCSTDLEVTFSDAVTAGSCANESTITRTWTLTDECDNTTTLVQTITVVDTTEPT
ncbi:beta strand repeat-containing protein, partial [Winogradskyella ursingii]|uniref:beta strand repeat-containing protein n=1 Tax=Winogradskyella ursingii TaxID=2686079 RepID=UPI0015CD7EF2